MKKQMIKAIEKHGMKVYGNLIMISGNLYPLPLVKGNTKLGTTVWHASTLPSCETITAKSKTGDTVTEKGTCPMTCNGCYGLTGNFRYESTRYWLIMRTKLLRDHMKEYFILVSIQLEYENVKKLRIHATGDFIEGEARGYIGILKRYRKVKAWTYTKCQIEGDIAELDSLPNCNVVKSIIKGCGFNFGRVAYIANLYYMLKRMGKRVYICRCGIDPNQHCSDCDGCSEHEYVLFLEHSTGYNPKTDYGYEKFIELVNNQ